MTFRFDDVCINANLCLIQSITSLMRVKFPDCRIIYGVSPLVHDMTSHKDANKERVFPSKLNALSDHRQYYLVDKAGLPDAPKGVELAGHGLVHVDHRLLDKGVQELSILASCSLVKAKAFIPPFNKWNKDTEDICRTFGVELIKFEDGWLSMEHNKFKPSHPLWYLHAREWTLEKARTWFDS